LRFTYPYQAIGAAALTFKALGGGAARRACGRHAITPVHLDEEVLAVEVTMLPLVEPVAWREFRIRLGLQRVIAGLVVGVIVVAGGGGGTGGLHTTNGWKACEGGFAAGLQETGGAGQAEGLAGNQVNAVLEGLHVLSQRGGVRVALLAAGHLAHVRLLH